ncbi:MAG: hypothetical protein IJW22_10205 [Clostridia bacterium]|nr:hypothetical protein [Clostridia bacterium]
MKKTLLCLLLALCLCLSCIMLIACNDDEEPVDDPATDVAPGDEEVGKKGEVTLFPNEENEVVPNAPNEKQDSFTLLY